MADQLSSGKVPMRSSTNNTHMDHELDTLQFAFGDIAVASNNDQVSKMKIEPNPTGTKLLHDLPRDIVTLNILPLCKPRDLVALVQTCKAMPGLVSPLLYKRLDLSDRPSHLPLAIHARVSFAERMQKQNRAIQGLLRDPDIAKHVRILKLTIGANYSLQSSQDLYRSFELLENVEHVDIHGILLRGFAPDNMPLTLQSGLARNIFPHAKTIKLRGIILFWLVERILLGGQKPELTTVELTRLTPGAALWPEDSNFLFHRHGQAYLAYFVRSRAQRLERWAVDGEERDTGPYDEDVVDMSLEDIRTYFLKPQVARHFNLWLEGVAAHQN
ncbi:hypothetical protein P171DRAFT_497312 [Karstenula rhodostoma CBS 690.94]|uniref:F-box domain-containing protein n=1 Tax=Karstenula rhodostoma CBS 690.94 TaxID=1392251 RepID=A0A9P4U8L4_9PLEO|nr:hypothetical protein P171DRAFT_497312 [Karstenula rhodostoma CBS 690.94]